MCLKFDNRNRLKLQSDFRTPWNLENNTVAYSFFLKKKQEKLLKWKVPCADTAMVVQAVSQMEFIYYFESYNMTKLEDKDKAGQTFA